MRARASASIFPTGQNQRNNNNSSMGLLLTVEQRVSQYAINIRNDKYTIKIVAIIKTMVSDRHLFVRWKLLSRFLTSSPLHCALNSTITHFGIIVAERNIISNKNYRRAKEKMATTIHRMRNGSFFFTVNYYYKQ